MQIYIKIILILLVIIIIFSFLNFYISIHPPKFKTNLAPTAYSLDYEEITLKTTDGLKLKGWFIPKKTDKAIIITHGYPFDKNNILGGTHFLAKKYNLLLFDFRYFGESEGKYTTVGYHETKDFLAAVQYLKDKNFTRIGAIGFSLGAATSLMANSPDVKAIVADSSYATIDKMIERSYFIFPGILKLPFVWLTKLYSYILLGISTNEISPLKQVPNIKSPILFIHGEKDTQIPVENTKLLYEASNKNKTILWLIPNVDHGAAHFYNPEEYEKKVIDFFEDNL
ncbi:MAG: alpha/beta fold hydrolase [Nanoarchaeota archaeon]